MAGITSDGKRKGLIPACAKRMETARLSGEGEMPSRQRWRGYQNLNANGVFMVFRLATDEHLHVLPETMLWMLKAKLQAMKREQENSGRNMEKCVSRWIGK